MKAVWISSALAVALSATSAIAAPQNDTDWTIPTYAGPYQPQGTDERGLWTLDDEDERILRDSRLVIRDEKLNAYVRRVLCQTVGESRCRSVRVYILRVPVFNASMSPNGTMRVFSGLLLRVRNEAELASVLGHEFAHFELRHTLAGYKRARSGSDLLAWSALLGATAARFGTTNGQSYQDLEISVLGTLYHFKRDDERASDRLGFSYMAAAGYRSSAAADVWRGVMNEADRSAEARGRPIKRYDGLAYFASHPTNLERADTLSLMANRVPGGEVDNSEAYHEALAPWFGKFLADQLAEGDFGATDYLLDRLAGNNWTPDLLFAKAENFRNRGNPRDLVTAVDLYRQVLAKDAGKIEAYRGLGLSLLRAGEVSAGKESLSQYLKNKPDASDAAILGTMIN
ncbi:MAG: peptidase M48 [Sphingomonadaceae bacterium]|nr:peptidase M48 [Sphingomonadaceae bacterium]